MAANLSLCPLGWGHQALRKLRIETYGHDPLHEEPETYLASLEAQVRELRAGLDSAYEKTTEALDQRDAYRDENRRLREACERALDYFTEKFGGKRTVTGDILRAALEAKP